MNLSNFSILEAEELKAKEQESKTSNEVSNVMRIIVYTEVIDIVLTLMKDILCDYKKQLFFNVEMNQPDTITDFQEQYCQIIM